MSDQNWRFREVEKRVEELQAVVFEQRRIMNLLIFLIAVLFTSIIFMSIIFMSMAISWPAL